MMRSMSTTPPVPDRPKHISTSARAANTNTSQRAGFIHLAPSSINHPGGDREKALCGVDVPRARVRETVMDWNDPSACASCVSIRKAQIDPVETYSGPNGEWDYVRRLGVVPVMFR